MKPFRYGLLLARGRVEDWHVECIAALASAAELAGVVAVQREEPLPQPSSFLSRWYSHRVERASNQDVDERLEGLPTISVGSRDQASDLDFILRLGPGPVPFDAASAAQYGVWYFEHEVHGARTPPFFDEVYEQRAVTRAALLGLLPDRTDAVVLEEGFFRTERRSYTANRRRVLQAIAGWPARTASRLAPGAVDPSSLRPATAVQRELPGRGPSELPRFLARVARSRLEVGLQRLFRHPQWNIGVLETPVEDLISPAHHWDDNVDWLPLDDRGSFLADPFGIVRDGTVHILCERFAYGTSKGAISAIRYRGRGSATRPEPAITPPGHISYPFLLETDGAVYCVPEMSQANEVALFRALEFPSRWIKVATLLDDFPGVDPTIFWHDDRWWLTCTKAGPQEDAELWAWHGAELKGPWTPHALNPIKTDVRSARPGGRPFHHRGSLYRPAQDCSRAYGWRIVLHRVLRLTPTDFLEEPVSVLQASPRSLFPHGRHTLSPVGDRVLVDGHRLVFVWPAFVAFLTIWKRDLASRLLHRT